MTIFNGWYILLKITQIKYCKQSYTTHLCISSPRQHLNTSAFTYNQNLAINAILIGHQTV